MILRAYVRAGFPCEGNLLTIGGFQQWSKFVQGAAKWITGADPVATQHGIESTEADDRAAILTTLENWRHAFGGSARTGREYLTWLRENPQQETARDALQELCFLRGAEELPSPKSFGHALRRAKDRIVGRLRLVALPATREGHLWRVEECE
jgi:hypothetical protein